MISAVLADYEPPHPRQKEIAILTRRVGESIIIDNPASAAEPITVTVLGVKGNQVRIGIAAPADITILREELLEPDTA